MTNFEKWQVYTDGLTSPQNFIDFGFYYLISAALQRRVWIGPEHMPLFGNVYGILVADPGIGKGLVIKRVADILHYHKLQPNPDYKSAKDQMEKEMIDASHKDDYRRATESVGGNDANGKEKKLFDKPLLIPVAADATTYEALVRAMSRSLRRINYIKMFENRPVQDFYTHSSLCFCLEEISSLFRKRTEDLVRFLIQAYDCGDYTYETKTQGIDRIKKCCLNFFGGTTPGFIQSSFDDQLLTEGFSSRTFFIFAHRNRKTALRIPDLTDIQKQYYNDLVQHVLKLSKLYGPVTVEESTWEWLEEWWKEAQEKRPNISVKLNPYYARKNIHVQKMAMAIHFGESTDMTVPKNAFERAIQFLGKEEKNMHFALGLDNTNPLASPTKKLMEIIRHNGRKTRRELLGELFEALPQGVSSLDEILEYLQATGRLISIVEEDKRIHSNITYYDMLRKEEID